MRIRRTLLATTAFTVAFAAFLPAADPQTAEGTTHQHSSSATQPSPEAVLRTAVLNDLRDEINSNYGFFNGVPRVNLGPCGRFARIFHQQWNTRFPDKVHIVFIMQGDGDDCRHVLVQLPDGNFYDGGSGTMSERALLMNFQNCRIDHMTQFDADLLDKRSYGLNRIYPLCRNYKDELTTRIVQSHLDQITGKSKP